MHLGFFLAGVKTPHFWTVKYEKKGARIWTCEQNGMKMNQMYVYVSVFLSELDEKYVSKYVQDNDAKLEIVVAH